MNEKRDNVEKNVLSMIENVIDSYIRDSNKFKWVWYVSTSLQINFHVWSFFYSSFYQFFKNENKKKK